MKLPGLALLLLALASAGAQAGCQREFSVGISDLGYSAYLRDGQWQGIAPELVAARPSIRRTSFRSEAR